MTLAMANFAPIHIEPAYRKVAAELLLRITERTVSVGDRLPGELELARQFGVNRSTVREALRELEGNGLLCRQRGSKRMMITRPANELISGGVSRALALHDVSALHVWEGLTILEPPIAAAAARHRQSTELDHIRVATERFVSAGTDTPAAVHQVAEFFRHIGHATHNRVLMLAHEPLLRLLEPSLGDMIDRVPQARKRIATAHRRVLAALRQRDADAASTWTARHVRDFRRGYEVAGIRLTHRVHVKP